MRNGWETKPFESCIEPVQYTRKIQRRDFLDEGKFPIVSQEVEFTNGYWNDETDVFRVSTPVVIFGDHTQVLKYVDFDFVLGADGVKILQPRDFFRPKFFFYQLQAANLVSLGYARHYRLLKELEINVPPLPEQQRIVGILDEAFARVATAKANAERNRHNARTLFESHLQSVFTQQSVGWARIPLGEFCSFENGDRGTNYPSKSARTATGIPFINAGHLTDDGIKIEAMDYISRERFNLLSNGKVRKGDILFCLRGSLGKFASVGDLSEGAIASSLVIVRPDQTVLNEFLIGYFRSPLCSEMINQYKNGAAQPNLSAQSLRKFIAPIPSLPEQKRVVKKLADLRDETQHLVAIYDQKLAALEALEKSLLHQAFSGDL